MIEKLKQVSAGTLARTVALFLALLNYALGAIGINPIPIAEGQLYELFSLAWLLVSGLIAWWKNNSFTRAAKATDGLLKIAKEKGELPIAYDASVNADLIPGSDGDGGAGEQVEDIEDEGEENEGDENENL
jgi:SPP1 family holin